MGARAWAACIAVLAGGCGRTGGNIALVGSGISLGAMVAVTGDGGESSGPGTAAVAVPLLLTSLVLFTAGVISHAAEGDEPQSVGGLANAGKCEAALQLAARVKQRRDGRYARIATDSRSFRECLRRAGSAAPSELRLDALALVDKQKARDEAARIRKERQARARELPGLIVTAAANKDCGQFERLRLELVGVGGDDDKLRARPEAGHCMPFTEASEAARTAARANKCTAVDQIGRWLQRADPAYYAEIFKADPALARCHIKIELRNGTGATTP